MATDMGAGRDTTPAGEQRLTTEVAELFPRQREWTEDLYFQLPDTPRIVELSERQLIVPPHPTHTHQRIVARLFVVLNSFVEARQLGVAQFSALPVRLWPGKIREPDILFLLREHADRIHEQYWGVPDLAIEVISPNTRKADREDKFLEYAQAGVQEYWLVDSEAETIEVYALRNQVYELFSKAGKAETARSWLLEGFQVQADEVFAK